MATVSLLVHELEWAGVTGDFLFVDLEVICQ
jgi:hypothetical protein